MSIETHVVDGKMAVLISPGYGAGWQSWNTSSVGEPGQLAMDKRIVEGFIAHGPKGAEMAALDIFGNEYVCLLGSSQLHIEWVPVGEAFEIAEYDGFEKLKLVGEQNFLVAR